MSNHKFTVRYDGRDFFGWQRHNDKPTIQGVIESAFAQVTGRSSIIYGAGRTDRGTHAEGQVFNVELPDELSHGGQLTSTIAALNAALPPTVRIVDGEVAAKEFHARASATGKIYRYEIWNAPDCPTVLHGRVWHVPDALQVDAMRAACLQLVGEKDFATFATRPNFKQKSTRRHLRRVDLIHTSERISIELEADGFLYKMVRNIVRALVKVGEGRTTQEGLKTILGARDRKAAPGTAPASGLFLDRVMYD